MTIRLWIVRHLLTESENDSIRTGLMWLGDHYGSSDGSNGQYSARLKVDQLLTALDGRRIR